MVTNTKVDERLESTRLWYMCLGHVGEKTSPIELGEAIKGY